MKLPKLPKVTKDDVIKNLRNPLSNWQTAALVAFSMLAYAYRAKQYLFKPQLFAEDGVLWLAQGHNRSILAIFEPVNGFFHLPERLFGFLVAQLPLMWAPALFVLSAWVLYGLLAYYLFTNRTKIFTNNFERIFMVLSLALISNIYELFFNFSNSVFLMGIIAILIMIAKPASNRYVNISEKTFFVLSCLTLPFCWFYVPVALFERYKYKKKNNFYLWVSIIGAILEGVRYITTGVDRSPVTLISLFSKYTVLEVYNQMFVPAVRFARIDTPIAEYSGIHHYPLFQVFFWIVLLAIATFVVIRKSNKQVWYLLFFLAAMSFASIKSPTLNVETAEDALKTMAVITGGSRYFVYGVLFVGIIVVKTFYLSLTKRARYIVMIAFIAYGFLTSYHYKSFFIEKNFVDYTPQYRQGITDFNKGAQSVDIPVNPTSWHMLLTR